MASERQLLEKNSPLWGEHIHRYYLAKDYIKEDDIVLDIACGSGFGTYQLANYTKRVVIGGDISAQTIQECKKTWSHKSNLNFQIMDGTSLLFPDNYFNKIVSFETIEHTSQFREMLSEFRRVLKPDGFLLLSTPNKQITSPDGVIKNPFHIQEFSLSELKEILNLFFFQDFQIYGQRNKRFDKKGIGKKIKQLIISFFNFQGIRRLPHSFKNNFVRLLTGIDLYPQSGDFILESDSIVIETQCPVLFAICKK